MDQQPKQADNARRRYIIVAEDDQFLSNAYAMKLEFEGYEVKLTTDGEEALRSIKERKPDLLLLDLIMPIMDGFTVLQALKSNTEFKDIPVIIASNLGDDENIQKGMAMGATDYLLKSDTSIDSLMKKVHSHFGTPINAAE